MGLDYIVVNIVYDFFSRVLGFLFGFLILVSVFGFAFGFCDLCVYCLLGCVWFWGMVYWF